ncbi:TlpA family protein disulfide reductase [Nocardioides pacificus]
MNTGAWVLIIAVLLAVAFGLYRAATDGRFRGTHRVRAVDESQPTERLPANEPLAIPDPDKDLNVLANTDIAHELGERATLLQFSSAFCAPCRATRRTLTEVAELVPGVTHIEVDAEHHLEMVRRLGILRTPTTLILDEHGQEITRAAGAPRKEAVLSTLSNTLTQD